MKETKNQKQINKTTINSKSVVGTGLASAQGVSTRGITLIALVITIIVLLILASVTINLTLGDNGIFTKANTAKIETRGASVEEAKKLWEMDKKIDENSETKTARTLEELIDDLLKQNLLTEDEKDKILGNKEKNIEAEYYIEIGSHKIDFSIDETVPNTPEAPIIDNSVLALKAGDYIKYDSGTNGEILCRVLYPADSEYGLQIISNGNVKNVTIGSNTYSEAVESYNNAIEMLNNEAEAYINTEYAYDARCVGSVPTVNKGMFTKKDAGATTYETYAANSKYINSLSADTNYETDMTQMKSVGINMGIDSYFLASRNVLSPGSYCSFYIRICMNGNLNMTRICHLNSGPREPVGSLMEFGLRPCISLRSNIIKITGGTGKDSANAYIIGK